MTYQVPNLRGSVGPMLASYDAALAAIPVAIAELEQAASRCEAVSQIMGVYGRSIWGSFGKPLVSERGMQRSLRVSAWRHFYEVAHIGEIAPAADRARFEREMDDPPDFTLENLVATFGSYLSDPRGSILRGLAEVFSTLDPAYRSHAKVKIGVKGLPKRVIVAGCGSRWGHGRQRLVDTVKALRTVQGRGPVAEVDIEAAIANGEGLDGITFRAFGNGNVHIHFDATACLDINRALAEFYGDVLPDAEDEDVPRRASTEVSKDLAYYPTPRAVADALVDGLPLWSEGARALEPSCGCGRVLDALRPSGAVIRGIEVHPGRAAEARARGYSVQTANFLDVPPDPTFDAVAMNPPFVGRHWRKHVSHAQKFLKPSGVLRCILPGSAWYDGHLDGAGGRWNDLPVGSFAESGTNVPTGIWTWRAGR